MWAAYDVVTGDLVVPPQNEIPAAVEGQQIVELPGSAEIGLTVWSSELRGWVDPPTLSTEAFVRCFTDAEVSAMFAAATSVSTAWVAKAIALTCTRDTIVLGHAEVVATIDGLTAIGILTPARAGRVKAGLSPL